MQFGPFHLLNEEEARLPCQPSTAAPRPAIQWLREGELITYNENSRYQLEEDGTLVIKQVDKDQDAVNYTCKALNFKGEAAVSAVLTVIGKTDLTFLDCRSLTSVFFLIVLSFERQRIKFYEIK